MAVHSQGRGVAALNPGDAPKWCCVVVHCSNSLCRTVQRGQHIQLDARRRVTQGRSNCVKSSITLQRKPEMSLVTIKRSDDDKSILFNVEKDVKPLVSGPVIKIDEEAESKPSTINEECGPPDSGTVLFATDLMDCKPSNIVSEEKVIFPRNYSSLPTRKRITSMPSSTNSRKLVLLAPCTSRAIRIPSVPMPFLAQREQPIVLVGCDVQKNLSVTPMQLVPIRVRQPLRFTVASDATPQFVCFSTPSSSVPIQLVPPSNPPSTEEPPKNDETSKPKFPGRRYMSKRGSRSVMCYEIPGTRWSYIFAME
ncbi:unnamed protein product, partial [Strongylus vulgaris]